MAGFPSGQSGQRQLRVVQFIKLNLLNSRLIWTFIYKNILRVAHIQVVYCEWVGGGGMEVKLGGSK